MRTFQIKPVPELVNWSRRRMISTTRASICPAISMMAVSGSVRVCSSKRRSRKRTCKYVRRTWARKSRSKGLCAHCFRVVSSRKVAGRACQCSSAFCWMILVEAVNLMEPKFVRSWKSVYLAFSVIDASCLSWSNSQTSSFKEAHIADQRVSAL